ncbi:MAG: hypothetical protein WCK36_04420, partial [Candidatus Firestonebacteria bacterium]
HTKNLTAFESRLKKISETQLKTLKSLKALDVKLKTGLKPPTAVLAESQRELLFQKKLNAELRCALEIKEDELKKHKENKYLNEIFVKKENSDKEQEIERVRQEYREKLAALEKKHLKEKELLEQYLKTAKNEIENIKKEAAIKKILSDL